MTTTTALNNLIAEELIDPIRWIAIGDNDLELSRRPVRTTQTGATTTFKAEWNIEDDISGVVSEAKLLHDDGTIICESEFSPINKGLVDDLTITWNLTIKG